MALIPVSAYDYKTAIVAARVQGAATAANSAFIGDARGFASVVGAANGTLTVTLSAEALVKLAEIIPMSAQCETSATLSADGSTGRTPRLAVESVNQTTGVIVYRVLLTVAAASSVANDGYVDIAAADIYSFSLLLRYNQDK